MKLLLVLLVVNLNCLLQKQKTNQNGMELKPSVENNRINVQLINNSQTGIKIWEMWNSWGWNSLYFVIKENNSDVEFYLRRDPNRDWTLNYPSFDEIPPNMSKKYRIDFQNGDWEINNNMSILTDSVVVIKAVLEIPTTPESTTYGVFVGKLESNWIESKPPHLWLYPKNGQK